MATLEKTNPPALLLTLKLPATTGSNNPFPTKVAMILSITAGKPRLTKPSRNPLLWGTILQCTVFMNLAIPKPQVKIEKTSL